MKKPAKKKIMKKAPANKVIKITAAQKSAALVTSAQTKLLAQGKQITAIREKISAAKAK